MNWQKIVNQLEMEKRNTYGVCKKKIATTTRDSRHPFVNRANKQLHIVTHANEKTVI